MKKLTIIALLTSILLLSCDDTVSNVQDEHHETLEEQIAEFIHHVEDDHFGKVLLQDTVAISTVPALNSVGKVYSLVFDGATSGKATFTFPEGDLERTFISNEPFTLKILKGTEELSVEDTVDLSNFEADVIKQMHLYDIDLNTAYEIQFSDVNVDTLKLFIAPRGLEEEDGHGH